LPILIGKQFFTATKAFQQGAQVPAGVLVGRRAKSLGVAGQALAEITDVPVVRPTAFALLMGPAAPKAFAKLADEIRNLCDLIAYPLDWSLARRQRYLYWARKVTDGLRGECNELETEFDRRYQLRPTK
jgi:hypothetical protein